MISTLLRSSLQPSFLPCPAIIDLWCSCLGFFVPLAFLDDVFSIFAKLVFLRICQDHPAVGVDLDAKAISLMASSLSMVQRIVFAGRLHVLKYAHLGAEGCAGMACQVLQGEVVAALRQRQIPFLSFAPTKVTILPLLARPCGLHLL